MDDSGSPLIPGVIAFVLFLLIDWCLYAFSMALSSVSDSELERQGKETDTAKAEWILNLKDEPDKLISTIQVLNAFFGVFNGFLFLHALPLSVPTLIAAFLLYLLVFYSLGIRLPKLIGKHHALGTVFFMAPTVKSILTLCIPVTFVYDGAANLLARLIGVRADSLQDDVTEEEIISMVKEGHEQGVLEASEAEMIHNIFELGDKDAGDIMTHRTNIEAVDGCQNLKSALDYMLEEANSRFPVYMDDIDNIIGILHLKDAMKCHTTGLYDDWLVKDIPNLMMEAVFIPETRNIAQLFKSMQSKKLQMVMVADEYGQTAGLVALEDILEEIVGNIQDEYDEEELQIQLQEDGSYLMSGMTPLEEVGEVLDRDLIGDTDIETLNGYLISRLDKIPDEDEHSIIEAEGYAFCILNVENKMIEKVHVKKLSESKDNVDSEQKI